jgi:hypothetical protein
VNAVKQVLDLNQSGKSLENVEDDAKKVYKTFIDVRSAGKAKQHHLPTKFPSIILSTRGLTILYLLANCSSL